MVSPEKYPTKTIKINHLVDETTEEKLVEKYYLLMLFHGLKVTILLERLLMVSKHQIWWFSQNVQWIWSEISLGHTQVI